MSMAHTEVLLNVQKNQITGVEKHAIGDQVNAAPTHPPKKRLIAKLLNDTEPLSEHKVITIATDLNIKLNPASGAYFIKPANGSPGAYVNKAVADVLFGIDSLSWNSTLSTHLQSLGYDKTEIETELPVIIANLSELGFLKTSYQDTSRNPKVRIVPHLECLHQLDSISIALTKKCNLNCVYCYDKDDKIDEWNWSDLEELISHAIYDCGVTGITFTGGEPTLYPHLFDAVQYASSRSVATRIITNGLNLNNEALDHLKSVGINSIAFSLDSTDSNDLWKITGIRYGPQQIFNLMRRCNELGIFVELNVVLVHNLNMNTNTLKMFEEYLRGIELNYISVTEAVPARDVHRADILKDDSFINNIHSCFGEYNSSCFEEIERRDEQIDVLCGMGRRFLFIKTNGDVYVCPTIDSLIAGNLKKHTLKDIWLNSETLKHLRFFTADSLSECKFCTKLHKCRGGCRARAYRYFGDYTAVDPISCILYSV